MTLSVATRPLLAGLFLLLAGCAGPSYTTDADIEGDLARAKALADSGQYREAAAAYERLASPRQPYLLPSSSLSAWEGAAKAWAGAGERTQALAAVAQYRQVAQQNLPAEPGTWPIFMMIADQLQIDVLARVAPEEAKAQRKQLAARMLELFPRLPPREQVSGSGQMQVLAKALADQGDAAMARPLAVAAAKVSSVAGSYDLAIQLVEQLQPGSAELKELRRRQAVVAEAERQMESGQLPYPPYRKVGDTYTSTSNTTAQSASFYTARGKFFRSQGLPEAAAPDEAYAQMYAGLAADEVRREAESRQQQQLAASQASSTGSSAGSGSGGSALIGGLLQGAGMAMQQSGYTSNTAAQGMMLEGIGAALAGDQQSLQRTTTKAQALSGQQNSMTALAYQLANAGEGGSVGAGSAAGGGASSPTAAAAYQRYAQQASEAARQVRVGSGDCPVDYQPLRPYMTSALKDDPAVYEQIAAQVSKAGGREPALNANAQQRSEYQRALQEALQTAEDSWGGPGQFADPAPCRGETGASIYCSSVQVAEMYKDGLAVADYFEAVVRSCH